MTDVQHSSIKVDGRISTRSAPEARICRFVAIQYVVRAAFFKRQKISFFFSGECRIPASKCIFKTTLSKPHCLPYLRLHFHICHFIITQKTRYSTSTVSSPPRRSSSVCVCVSLDYIKSSLKSPILFIRQKLAGIPYYTVHPS